LAKGEKRGIGEDPLLFNRRKQENAKKQKQTRFNLQRVGNFET